ncbi:MAG TPA: sel1 repeat family protein, partial [Vineibacter sp.]|nr:sel1 repeat family protein [Vineibacter sp.]
QYKIGVAYQSGRGVPRDPVQAHMWLSLAAAKDNTNAARARERLATSMTAEQIAEALRLAREWKPTTGR